MNTIQQQLYEACLESEGLVKFINEYSGRLMFGKQCVAISGTFHNCMMVVSLVVIWESDLKANSAYRIFNDGSILLKKEIQEDALILESFNERNTILHTFSVDSLGEDMILYWPILKPVDN